MSKKGDKTKKKFGFDEWSAMIFDSLLKGHEVIGDIEIKKKEKSDEHGK